MKYLVFLKTIQKTTGPLWTFKSYKRLREFLIFNKKDLRSYTVFEVQTPFKQPEYPFNPSYSYYKKNPKDIIKNLKPYD